MVEENEQNYVVDMSRDLCKSLKRIRRSGQGYIIERLEEIIPQLEMDPHTNRPGVDIKLISTRKESRYRVRIGDYRLIYEVDEETKIVQITALMHRSKIY